MRASIRLRWAGGTFRRRVPGGPALALWPGLIPLLVACGSPSALPLPGSVEPLSNPTAAAAASSVEMGVRVLDGLRRPLPGARTEWEILAGGGELGASQVSTDGAGVARTAWTVGTVAGAGGLRVRVAGLDPLDLTLDIEPGPVTRISVVPDSVELFATGDTTTLVAQAWDEWENEVPSGPRDFEWSTSDAAVAAVSEEGLVTAVGPGTAVITARRNGASGQSVLVVSS
jgi:hypothetical protein